MVAFVQNPSGRVHRLRGLWAEALMRTSLKGSEEVIEQELFHNLWDRWALDKFSQLVEDKGSLFKRNKPRKSRALEKWDLIVSPSTSSSLLIIPLAPSFSSSSLTSSVSLRASERESLRVSLRVMCHVAACRNAVLPKGGGKKLYDELYAVWDYFRINFNFNYS